MRVAHVTDWFAPRRGGIELQIEEVATRLSAAGTEVTVVTSTPGASQERPFAIRRLDVLTLPSPPLAISPALIGALRRELDGRYDVVHAHVSVVSPTGWAAAWVARSLGLPCAVTFHSVLRAKAIALRALSAAAPLGNAGVAWNAVSAPVARRVSWALGDAAVSVLPNGTDVAWWSSMASKEPKGDLTLVSAMRMHRKKRGLALVRAFASAVTLVDRHVRLVLVGEGSEREAIAREARALGLVDGPHRVELQGWSSRERLRELYADADAFVTATVHEAFGIAALEAAAAGLPVIARRSGVEEFIRDGENGLIADSDAALAGAMRSFVTDDALRARLRPAPTDLSRFDWRAVVAAHLAEYERAIRLGAIPGRAVAVSA